MSVLQEHCVRNRFILNGHVVTNGHVWSNLDGQMWHLHGHAWLHASSSPQLMGEVLWQKHVLNQIEGHSFSDPFSSSPIELIKNAYPTRKYQPNSRLFRLWLNYRSAQKPIRNWRHPGTSYLGLLCTLSNTLRIYIHRPSFSHYRPLSTQLAKSTVWEVDPYSCISLWWSDI